MGPKVITVAGTHGLDDDWWKPDSAFARELEKRGFSYTDRDDPYAWSTSLDGLLGSNASWEAAGRALRWYVGAKCGECPVTVIAHSHGAQVAAYACAQGLMVERLITCAAPVRKDMQRVWEAARSRIGSWTHLHGRCDKWAIMGAIMDGRIGVGTKMPLADFNIEVPIKHSEFVDVKQWNMRNWWHLLLS